MYRLQLGKRKQQIAKEIPHGGSTHGKHLTEVEIPFQLAIEEINRQCVDTQADQRNDEILGIFHPDLRVAALESPNAVEKVIRCGGENETEDVAQVFVPLQPLLANIGHAKVDEHARKAHHAEFQELQQKFTGQFYLKQQSHFSFFVEQK